MKTIYITLLTFISFIFASCSGLSDEIEASVDDYTKIEIIIPTSDYLKTRSFGDGLTVNTLRFYAYSVSKETGNEPDVVGDIPLRLYSDHMGASYTLSLPNFQSYDLVFIATSCTQNNSDEKIYYDQANRTININYDVINTNDEGLDCFWGVIKNVSPGNSDPLKITLKRPFAQLNIGTKDFEIFNEMSSSSLQSVAVAVDGVYTTMNVMNGSVTGKVNLSFPHAYIPSDETFPISECTYLSMNYLLVNDTENHDVVMNVKNQSSSFDTRFTNIPLKRNNRTCIYGNILTNSNDYNVEIINDYIGAEDKEVDKYEGYDLVLKMVDNYQSLPDKDKAVKLYYKILPNSDQIEIDITNYVDNTNTLKVTWEELGITSADNLCFSSPSITSLKKYDYKKIGIKSFSYLFSGCSALSDIDAIKNWDTNGIVNMSGMFYCCSSLQHLDLSSFDTSKVTDFKWMFSNCISLKSINLSNFDTSAAKSMYGMFLNCESLSTLDVSKFVTNKVTDMSYMFSGCSSLQHLDLSMFNTSNVSEARAMFQNCRSLTSLDISNFDTSNFNCFCDFFQYCSKIQHLNISHFKTTKATAFDNMFDGCEALTSIDVSNFNTSNATSMSGMFQFCSNLKTLDIRNFNVSKITNIDYFTHATPLNTIYLNFNFSKKLDGYRDHHSSSTSANVSLDINAQNIEGQISNINTAESIWLQGNTNISYSSFMKIINALVRRSNMKMLYVNQTQYNWLGASLRDQLLNNKNWYVVKY